ncbi:HTH domain protein [Natronomonas pharaonis DSM 2160]|uniref:HTH domain protein n=1 Tax=Natronomonas pharaonis (strain ATCC 35678 / DSM 2160 / CIP 103997 / JCM 8858 / NBRC 14720 / NCIMB 2260 / Gabara) TaxID=348780 RepID=A0A1U7EUJ2_NATPD|nr:winged helix-turn-helix transcriptional regulator [Natronomonas pharaonis]CAI48655.1 HTH domain protein [Natronomonas pharaonis DSM 2160]
MTDGGIDEGKRATLKRFAALGATTPLVRLSADDGGENETRDAIVGYLATTPGAHFSKLRDDLQLGTGETQHHLRTLEEDGTIEHRKDGEYKRYFPAGRFSEHEQRALGYLRRETPRRMLIELLSDPQISGSDIADALGVSRSTVSKYAAELEAAGLLDREDGYTVRQPETLVALVVRYADSFGPAAVAFADTVDEYVSYDPP